MTDCLKTLIKLYIDFKLLRVKKSQEEDRSLAIKLATQNDLDGLDSIQDFIVNELKIKYKHDPFWGLIDIQSTFIEFLSKKQGDCDDFQLQYTYLQYGVGYDPLYVTLINKKITFNHQICITPVMNLYYVLDTTVPYQLGPFKTIKDILNYYSDSVKSEYIFQDIRDQYLRIREMKLY